MKAKFSKVWLTGMLSALDMHGQDEVVADVVEAEEGEFVEFHTIEQDGKIIPRSDATVEEVLDSAAHDTLEVDAGSLMKLPLERLREICDELLISTEGLKKAELVNAILAKKAESPA